MFYVLLSTFLSSLLVVGPVNSQASFGVLGRGLLNSEYLQTGGLHYPNADGSGPQAQSLAAAIYGVAIPPGFNQFSASENFFGAGNDVYGNAFGGEVKASDLLVGTGIHNPQNGRDQGGSYSSFISDFSVFGTTGFPSDGDQRSSSSSLIEIDPIAARFGVVISNHEHQASLFHPSLSGSTESLSGGTSTGNENGLSRVDESSTVDPAAIPNLSLPSVTDTGKSSVDIITSAFKFSDDQIGKTEELKRNFEKTIAAHIASGKFVSTLPSAEIDTGKKAEEESKILPPTAVKQTSSHSPHQPASYPKPKEVKILSKPGIVSKSNSPYTYRGSNRERQQAQQSETTATFSDAPENLPTAEFLLDSQPKKETSNLRPAALNPNHHSYNFLTAPGYRTHE